MECMDFAILGHIWTHKSIQLKCVHQSPRWHIIHKLYKRSHICLPNSSGIFLSYVCLLWAEWILDFKLVLRNVLIDINRYLIDNI